jgi:hypothetical protein
VDFQPAVIPVPSYLFDDDQLLDIVSRLNEVDAEVADDSADRSRETACIAAIRTELAKRGRPISL